MNKMTKIALISLLVTGLAQGAQSEMLVILPSASVLKNRLTKAGFGYFLEKTNLHETLGGTEKYPSAVNLAVDLAYYDVLPSLSRSAQAGMLLSKPLCFMSILQDYPEALMSLVDSKVLDRGAVEKFLSKNK